MSAINILYCTCLNCRNYMVYYEDLNLYNQGWQQMHPNHGTNKANHQLKYRPLSAMSCTLSSVQSITSCTIQIPLQPSLRSELHLNFLFRLNHMQHTSFFCEFHQASRYGLWISWLLLNFVLLRIYVGQKSVGCSVKCALKYVRSASAIHWIV
jgi:hypothetical protein